MQSNGHPFAGFGTESRGVVFARFTWKFHKGAAIMLTIFDKLAFEK